ncbi:MAG: O-antigen ligase family protein [Nostoc sp. NMS1]|uniref:O-antigen ligase family protein n=1 Tax=unclassified Nostoc TaxID=2593658 RepID=UPI0025E019BB|nr:MULTISPECIES: O-antigen ligase family protein [unclassified Nostoc]MBN3906408.1 O-antigen ligase family protein [Nostoc sp. NMS1]MBN3991814.1 O-antigen ligase family protein [Nostoc sp. NMS2]
MRKLLIFAEQIFTFTCLMLYSGTPLDAFLTDGFTVKEGDRTIFRLLYTLTYIVSLSLITLRWKKVTYAFSKDKFIWILIGVSALSSFWSLDPDITMRRVIGLAGTTIFGLYLASRYTLKQQLKLCAYMLAISIVMCLIFVIFIPQFGIDPVFNSWRGIFPTKNVLGKRFVLSAAVFFFLAITAKENRLVLWLGYIFSGVLILLSQSATSLVNFIIITVAFLVYYRILHLKYKVIVPILTLLSTFGIAFYYWFILQSDAILGSIGKDATLTGRAELWPVVLEMIGKKPWLGYGYGVFWENSSESSIVLQTVQWNAPNAHNGFLDLWLALGLLGFLVFIIGLVINLFRAIYLIRRNQTSESIWLLVYLTFMILSNLTESTLLIQNSMEWILYVAAIFSSQLSTRANL